MPFSTPLEHYQILTAMLAPALFMTASASLTLSANNRLARVVDRLRTLFEQLERSTDASVRSFAETMVRDHEAVNKQALALVTRLGVTPEANATSSSLTAAAAAARRQLASLRGKACDRAYVEREAAYHAAVNKALADFASRRPEHLGDRCTIETRIRPFDLPGDPPDPGKITRGAVVFASPARRAW